jgi:hypothetical protein
MDQLPEFPDRAGEKSNASMPINGKPWFIVFWLWDINLGKMVRMRNLI